MSENNGNKGSMIVLLIFLLICSGLGIAAFVMSLKGCVKDGFVERPPLTLTKSDIYPEDSREEVGMGKDQNPRWVTESDIDQEGPQDEVGMGKDHTLF